MEENPPSLPETKFKRTKIEEHHEEEKTFVKDANK